MTVIAGLEVQIFRPPAPITTAAPPASLTFHYTVYCSRLGPKAKRLLWVHSLFTGH